MTFARSEYVAPLAHLARTIADACEASDAVLLAGSPSRVVASSSERAADPAAPRCTIVLDSGCTLVLYGRTEPPPRATAELAALVLRTSLENEALRANGTRLERQARATVEVSREISGLRELGVVLQLVAERSRELLRGELAGVALLDEATGTIAWPAMSGARTDTHLHALFPADGGVAGRAITTHRPVVVNDLLLDATLTPASNPISFAEGIRAILAVPMDISERARGCVMIGYRSPRRFSAQELDVLSSFASQAAIAVENAELYDRAKRDRARMASLVESMDEGLLLVDNAGSVAHVNRRAEEIFGVPRGAITGGALGVALAALGARSDDPAKLRAKICALIDAGERFPTCDIRLTRSPLVELRLTAFHVYDSGGIELGRGLLFRDVTFERHVDMLKSDVIAIVSHEIRSPLASIGGCASALLDTARNRTPELQHRYLETIERESARLDDLVSRLTDVSLLDAGVFTIEPRASDPIALLERVIERRRGERTIALDALRPTSPLAFDHRRIEQVVENLLDNALKYSPGSSAVAVRAIETDRELVVAVSDTGVGIERGLHERVFERFYRIEGVRRKEDGSGLGLYICRGIVEAHGGRIWLESSPGGGTTVAFSLPRETVAA